MIPLESLYKLKALQHSDVAEFRCVFKKLPTKVQAYVASHWYFKYARFEQVIPWHEDWYMQVFKPGRGWGKNWMLSRNIIDDAESNPNFRINVFAKTQGECNDTIILGESGIANALAERGYEMISGNKMDVPKVGQVIYLFSKDHIQLKFWNGSLVRFYSAKNTRGRQGHRAYADEIFTWFEDETGRDQKLRIALEEIETITRLGTSPRIVLTSTPQPVGILKDLYNRAKAGEKIVFTSGSTFDNPSLSDTYLKRMQERYGNTRRGQQELYGNELWEIPGALWNASMFKYTEALPDNVVRTLVAIDPAATNNKDSDETGIVVVAKTSDKRYYVLADKSFKGSPKEWATAAIRLYNEYECDKIVYESNQGGDMVAETLKNVQRSIPLKAVRASKGKYARAEPIAALYEQGKVFHVGNLAELERQLCEYNPDLYKGSPDRLDALVWGIHELSTTGEYGVFRV